MNRFRFSLGVALIVGLLAAGAANAQTPANITAYSGNGQMICLGCFNSFAVTFQLMTAQVTDANGLPVGGVNVTWTITGGGVGGQLLTSTSTTDGNGMASNSFVPAYITGSTALTFLQTTITATAGNVSTAFTLTQGLPNPFNGNAGGIAVFDVSQLLGQHPELGPAQQLSGGNLSGQIGTTAAPPIKVRVLDTTGAAIPNVAVNLYNLQTGPTVQCGGANAINATVLTDATGIAICNPLFSGTPGQGRFDVMIGAVESTAGDPNNLPQSMGFGWNMGLTVTPGRPGSFTLFSGNNQSAQAGFSLSNPLVVQVSAAGGGGLSGQTVNWSVSPTGAAALSASSSVTDSNGRASTAVTFNSAASGTVTVTATLAGSTLAAVPFTLTAVPNVTITSLTAVSGGGQAAIVSSGFGAPLVVKVNVSAGSALGTAVQFSASPAGSVTFSPATATADVNGNAQTTVTAGNTAGPVTVTATAGSQSTTFSLTVSPPGPTLTAAGFINAADLQRGAISPCSLATILATGVAPGLQNTVLASTTIGPLPTTLSGDQVIVGGVSSPIASVGMTAAGQQQITFQVPCETTPGSSVQTTVNVGAGTASINVPVQSASPGVFTTTLSDNNVHAVALRPDGSFASIQNPARKGETVTAFVTGLGPSIPAVGTNAVPPPGVAAAPSYQVVVGMAGGGVPFIGAQLSPDRVGVWMVTFQIPVGVSAPNGLATFSVSVIPTGASTAISSGTTTIPVQ